MIRREVLLSHSEAVATASIHVQFSRFVRVHPLLIQSNALRRQSELIICCSHSKHRWCIERNGITFKHCPGRIDWGHEGGPTIKSVTEGNPYSDRSTSGEADDPDAVGGNSPFRRMLSNVGDRS